MERRVDWSTAERLEQGQGMVVFGVTRVAMERAAQRLNAKHGWKGVRFGVRTLPQGLTLVRLADIPVERLGLPEGVQAGSAMIVDVSDQVLPQTTAVVDVPRAADPLGSWRTAIDALALDEELDITALRTSELVQLLNGKIGVDEEDAVRLGSPAYIVEKDGDTKLLVRVA